MKSPRMIFVLILVWVLFPACVHTQPGKDATSQSSVLERISQRGTLIVGTAGSMPPFNMTTKQGEVIGIEPDMAKLMAQEMGVKLRLESMAFSELLPALKAGEIDLILSQMTITGKRNMGVAFVGPYFISGKSFVTKVKWMAAVKEASEVNSPKTRLAALKGSTSAAFVTQDLPKARLVTAEDYEAAVDMVLKGKVDALVADYPICVLTVLRHPGKGLIAVSTPLNYEPIGIAVRRNDPLMVNWLENYLNTLTESGLLDSIKDRWLKNHAWLNRLP